MEDIGQLKDDLEGTGIHGVSVRSLIYSLPAGFEVREKMYRNFPEALLQWKLSLEIVSIIIHVIIHVQKIHL